MQQFYTAESVARGHPDKLCDQIADAILDDCLACDPTAHVACEALATKGHIIVAGELTSSHVPEVGSIVRSVLKDVGYDHRKFLITNLLHRQSLDIAEGIAREQGAGDQGVMVGYACNETWQYLPLPVVLAHRITMGLTEARRNHLLEWLRSDGKAQVSVEYEDDKPVRVRTVVVSTQHEPEVSQKELREAVYQLILVPALGEYLDQNTEILINPSGSFVLGGFEADTGLTGRKLMVDTYGGLVPHGGGALSGKDGTKVDRSGTYMARYIAKNIVAAGLAERCTVSLAYAIGKAEPVAVDIDTHGTGEYAATVLEQAVHMAFDWTPDGMIRTLGLDRPIFAQYCNYGHFMYADAPWERTNKTELLAEICRFKEAGASRR